MTTNELKITLSDAQWMALIDSGLRDGLFKELFNPSAGNYAKLAYELQREFKAGGSPEVTKIDFDRLSFDADAGVGKFRILLDINFTFGCEDVKTEKYDQTSEWSFSADSANRTLILRPSPFVESRSTADEF